MPARTVLRPCGLRSVAAAIYQAAPTAPIRLKRAPAKEVAEFATSNFVSFGSGLARFLEPVVAQRPPQRRQRTAVS